MYNRRNTLHFFQKKKKYSVPHVALQSNVVQGIITNNIKVLRINFLKCIIRVELDECELGVLINSRYRNVNNCFNAIIESFPASVIILRFLVTAHRGQ